MGNLNRMCYILTQTWGPFHQRKIHLWFKDTVVLYQMRIHIFTHICTCPDSCAVMACAKYCGNLQFGNWIITKKDFFNLNFKSKNLDVIDLSSKRKKNVLKKRSYLFHLILCAQVLTLSVVPGHYASLYVMKVSVPAYIIKRCYLTL